MTLPARIARTSIWRASGSQRSTRYYSAPVDSQIPESKIKYVPTSGTYPQGFRVSGTHVGVKASNTKNPDLAFIVSDVPSNAAAVFTTNKFQAAPVQVCKTVLQRTQGSNVRSIIINAGCANAVTGSGGVEDAHAMANTAASCISEDKEPSSLVMSTGVIGQRLPIQKILDKIPEAYSNLDSSHDAWLTTARAICTTDTFPKLLSTTFSLPSPGHRGTKYSLAGMTKGAGMIHPNMATLLGIICTDAPISPPALQSLLVTAVNKSFNSISIDGDTSTNDTVAILANGAASPTRSRLSESSEVANNPESSDYKAMSLILTEFTQKLSQLVVRDGEGATKFICVTVRNAPTYNDAHAIASTIARSPLVKTALYGKDANWGRVLCAVGYTNPSDLSSPDVVMPEKISVSYVPSETSKSQDEGVLKLLVNGEPQQVDEARAARLLEDEDLEIDIDLGNGTEVARYWFCDFSHEYVTINADYRT